MSTLFSRQDSLRTDPPHNAETPLHLHEVVTEAPDKGELEQEPEAPEDHVTRHAEAPDAGFGRPNRSIDEQGFTQGRSRG